MIIITRDQVKAQLGITTSDYDTQIDAQIPIIDAKVKQITNNDYNYRFAGDMTDTETTLTVYSLYTSSDQYGSGINNPNVYKDITKSLDIGMEIQGANIPTGTYITNMYNSGTVDVFGQTQDLVYIEISEAVTDTASGVIITAGMNIAYHPTIAKGVWYLIDTTSMTVPCNSISSESYGPVSLSYGTKDQEIDNRYGMPAWFVKAFPKYASGV